MADEQPYKETEDGRVLVGLKLAHPLAEKFAARCQAEEVRDYAVGETIFVAREWGNALIDAGRVQVDPIDADARKTALLLNRRNQPLTAAELRQRKVAVNVGEADGEVGEGGGDADAATPAKVEGGAAATPASAGRAGTKGRSAS